jgi:hypothetical protein
MLHETAARAEEVLSLDIDELDLRNRRAKVRREGDAADIIVWRTQTAQLPPRLLDGRRTGCCSLTDWRGWNCHRSTWIRSQAGRGCPTDERLSASRTPPRNRQVGRGRYTGCDTRR